MRLAPLASLLVWWPPLGVTGQQIRGAAINTNANSVVKLGDEEEKHVIISRALGKRGPASPSRSLVDGFWLKWQRTFKRSAERQKKSRKQSEDDEAYYKWVTKYREQVKKWRKQQHKKGTAEKSGYYESSSGVFRIKLPLFSSKTAYGYTNYKKRTKNVRLLEHDVNEALQFKVKLFLERDQFTYRQEYGPDVALPVMAQPEEGNASPEAGEVDDFETNTVEENVDEGDLLKVSDDGKYAFTVFGANLVVWDVMNGNETVHTVPLPTIDVKDVQPPPFPQPRPLPLQVLREPQVAEDVQHDGNRKLRRREEDRDLQQVASLPLYYCWAPIIPTIHSLMVHEKRLIVIASGYQQQIWDKLSYKPAFYDAFNTKILVYDILDGGKLILRKEKDVHGRFDSIRAIGRTAHVVTFAGLDTYTHLDKALDRGQDKFKGMSDMEYRKAARRLAKQKLIPEFKDRIIEDISTNGEPADIARVSMWQRETSPDGKLEESVFNRGILQYYAVVTSFDMQDSSKLKTLKVKQAGSFMPTAWGHTYANEDMLILAGQAWNWVGNFRASRQTTYFLGFTLLEDRAVPSTVGSLEGHLLNEYAIDIVDGYMRVAITIRNSMWRFAETENVAAIPPTQNFVKVLKIPDLDNEFDGPILKEVGSTESLGEENEVFTGVRFGTKVAYVITFFRTDPLYVIGFEDKTKPKVLGELKITGFSRYLHFVNNENTLVLGVGQEATNEGRVLGLQVTLYNAKDPKNPRIVKRFPFELEEQGVSSSSTAEFDFKAFRYVKLPDKPDHGILIIPFRVDDYRSEKRDLSFNGFALLDVSPTDISLRFRIPHSHPKYYTRGCYQSVRLAERSFVVKGNITTLKGHSIHTYNLDSQKRLDSIDLDPLET